ncbi:Golgi-associated plant pathogenesis-related protein 1, partial [Orchesella cincta]
YTLLQAVVVAEEGYQQIAREIHNQYRANHHVSALNSNDDLNNRAVQCAQYYALRGIIDHTCPYKNGAGENLWLQRGGNPTNDDTARSSSNSWYSEEPLHNYNGEFSAATGHFTQMVWKNSVDLGFGVGRRNGFMRFLPSVTVGCALYNPPGNVIGQFQDNVISP